MKFEIKSRKSLIVYIQSFRHLKLLKHYGSIVYVSHRMHYCVMYLDEDHYQEDKNKIKQLKFVHKILFSPYKELFNSFYSQNVDGDDE